VTAIRSAKLQQLGGGLVPLILPGIYLKVAYLPPYFRQYLASGMSRAGLADACPRDLPRSGSMEEHHYVTPGKEVA
jgi:hypothetical protein